MAWNRIPNSQSGQARRRSWAGLPMAMLFEPPDQGGDPACGRQTLSRQVSAPEFSQTISQGDFKSLAKPAASQRRRSSSIADLLSEGDPMSPTWRQDAKNRFSAASGSERISTSLMLDSMHRRRSAPCVRGNVLAGDPMSPSSSGHRCHSTPSVRDTVAYDAPMDQRIRRRLMDQWTNGLAYNEPMDSSSRKSSTTNDPMSPSLTPDSNHCRLSKNGSMPCDSQVPGLKVVYSSPLLRRAKVQESATKILSDLCNPYGKTQEAAAKSMPSPPDLSTSGSNGEDSDSELSTEREPNDILDRLSMVEDFSLARRIMIGQYMTDVYREMQVAH